MIHACSETGDGNRIARQDPTGKVPPKGETKNKQK